MIDDANALDDGVIRLRPLRADDAETTRAWRNDPVIWARTMGFRLPITESMEAAWYDALAADNGLTRLAFGIETAAGELVGFTQLNELDWFSGTASFGIVIGDERHRGQGFGRRALRLTTQYATDTLGLRKLTLKVVAFNDAALALYLDEGWMQEGRQVRQFLVDGEHHDVVLLGRFLDEP